MRDGKTLLPPLRGFDDDPAPEAGAAAVSPPDRRRASAAPEPRRATPRERGGKPRRPVDQSRPRRRGRPPLDEGNAGRKLPVYARRHTVRWLRHLEGAIEDRTGRIVNRSIISRAVLTGTEKSRLPLSHCGDEQSISKQVEQHLRAGRILLAAFRRVGIDISQVAPAEAVEFLVTVMEEGEAQATILGKHTPADSHPESSDVG
jgi:hypothetical protein